ncbi:MAG: LLM class flavin-dependent oxidoreductase [Acidimicrobiia bacterium]|nr:LLM class flavin-dependent oxidoreductase [Acidimicrobiia bacterium]
MKVALEVWSSDYGQVESTCLLAESLGLDAFYYGESPHDLNLDCWTTLAGLARATDRIGLGPVITNILPTYRSQVLLAKQAATVAAISEGRVDFRSGVGASARLARRWWEPFGIEYPDYSQRLSHLEQALTTLPRLWAGEPLNPASHSATGSTSRHRIPITVAASGDRAMGLAAAYADVWETSFCTPAEFAHRTARFSSLENDRRIVRSLEIDGFLSMTDEGLRRLHRRVRAERGADEDLDGVFSRALLGVPSDAVGRLEELEAVGVEQVVVALHDPLDPDAIHAVAETAALFRATNPPAAKPTDPRIP